MTPEPPCRKTGLFSDATDPAIVNQSKDRA